jgi:hypothetical protein
LGKKKKAENMGRQGGEYRGKKVKKGGKVGYKRKKRRRQLVEKKKAENKRKKWCKVEKKRGQDRKRAEVGGEAEQTTKEERRGKCGMK